MRPKASRKPAPPIIRTPRWLIPLLRGSVQRSSCGIRQARSATRQAQTATRLAEIASRRHREQTKADRDRRITESFSKATEQLGSDKVEVRLGGIYTLERISRESPNDYWTVMETLCAFVRERARLREPEEVASPFSEKVGETTAHVQPPTDIAAVLAVIVRRDEKTRQREQEEGWRLNFRRTDLRGADLIKADLRRALLSDANLSAAVLIGANLHEAVLFAANLSGAVLFNVNLRGAHLTRVNLRGVNLSEVIGLEPGQLAQAYGDAWTRLPANVRRPANWPPEAPEAAPHP